MMGTMLFYSGLRFIPETVFSVGLVISVSEIAWGVLTDEVLVMCMGVVMSVTTKSLNGHLQIVLIDSL